MLRTGIGLPSPAIRSSTPTPSAPTPALIDGPIAATTSRTTTGLANGAYERLLKGGAGGNRWSTVYVHKGEYTSTDAATFTEIRFYQKTLAVSGSGLGPTLKYAGIYRNDAHLEFVSKGCTVTRPVFDAYASPTIFPTHQGVAGDEDNPEYQFTADNTGFKRHVRDPARGATNWTLDTGGQGPAVTTYTIGGNALGDHVGGIAIYDGGIWTEVSVVATGKRYLAKFDKLTFALLAAYPFRVPPADQGVSGLGIDPVNRIIFGSVYYSPSYVRRWSIDLLSEASVDENVGAELSDLVPAGNPWFRAQGCAYRNGRIYMACENRRSGAGADTGGGAGPLVGVMDAVTGEQINELVFFGTYAGSPDTATLKDCGFDPDDTLLLLYDGSTTSHVHYVTLPADVPTSVAGLAIKGANGFKYGRRFADVRDDSAYTIISVLTPNSVGVDASGGPTNGSRQTYADQSLGTNMHTRVNTGGVIQCRGGNGTFSTATASNTMVVGTANVVISWFDPPNSIAGNRTLTSPKTTVAAGTTANLAKADLGFGTQGAGIAKPDCDMHMNLVFDGVVSDADQDTILTAAANGELTGLFTTWATVSDSFTAGQKAAAEAAA